MIKYQFFPRSQGITPDMKAVIACFLAVSERIDSAKHTLSSNEVLEQLRPHLEKIKFQVETGKSHAQKISVPVLFGTENTIDKSFNADALSLDGRIVLEVEAGRAVDNNQFLKDVFQACMMHSVEYLVIGVRNTYRNSDDFRTIYTFLETAVSR